MIHFSKDCIEELLTNIGFATSVKSMVPYYFNGTYQSMLNDGTKQWDQDILKVDRTNVIYIGYFSRTKLGCMIMVLNTPSGNVQTMDSPMNPGLCYNSFEIFSFLRPDTSESETQHVSFAGYQVVING